MYPLLRSLMRLCSLPSELRAHMCCDHAGNRYVAQPMVHMAAATGAGVATMLVRHLFPVLSRHLETFASLSSLSPGGLVCSAVAKINTSARRRLEFELAPCQGAVTRLGLAEQSLFVTWYTIK